MERKRFYESELHRMAEQVAEILDKGYTVEISQSRSGLKIFKVSRRYEVVKRNKITPVEK